MLVQPLTLVLLHAALIGTAQWIENHDAWNDENPTYLVALAIAAVDAPLLSFFDSSSAWSDDPGRFSLEVQLLGGVAWFLVGLSLSMVWVGVTSCFAAPQAEAESVH